MEALPDEIAAGDIELDVDISSREEMGVATRGFAAAVLGYLRSIASTAGSVAGGDLTVEPRSDRDALCRPITSDTVRAVSQIACAIENVAQGAAGEDGRAGSARDASGAAVVGAETADRAEEAIAAQQVSASTEETDASTQSIAARAAQVAEVARTLHTVVSRFRLEPAA